MQTLLEYAKGMGNETHRQGIVEIFGSTTDLLRVLPFETVTGGAYMYNREATLPGIAFRGINEAFAEGTGIINPLVETVTIAGGDLDVDRVLVNRYGQKRRAQEVAMKTKALAHTVSHKIVKGDSSSDPREFDGLQRRVTGTQLKAAGSTSGGDALSLLILDEAIDLVSAPMGLLMCRALRRRFTQAARTATVSGNIQIVTDQFGRQVTAYAGLPILEADADGDLFASLGFNEANPGGGSAVGTSIYVMSWGMGKMFGIQTAAMDARDLGEQDAKPVWRTRVDWEPGLVIEHPRAVSRLWGIKDAAIVA